MSRRALLPAALVIASLAAAAQQPYKVIDHWKIGGEGGWDYLLADGPAHRLYVTHGPRVDVVDTTTGKAVGAITDLKGTHGIALDPDGKLGYISDGGANAVIVFDRATLAKVASIPAGTNPDGIVFEPVTNSVWAFNGRSSNASVIDAASKTVKATIALPGKPEFPAADGRGTVFVNIEDKNEIVRLDAATAKITATWPLAGCDSPSGLAIGRKGMRLFSVCDGKTMVITDARNGTQIARAAIGDGPDAANFAPAFNLAFSSNGDGTLTVVNAGGKPYPVMETLPTKKGGRTMTYDETVDRIYISTADYGPAPAPTADRPHPRPTPVPGSFTILVVGR